MGFHAGFDMKLLIIDIVLFGIITLMLSGCGGLSETQRHYNAGVELGEQGRFEEAIAEYDEVIRIDPQLASAYNNRGVVHRSLDQLHQAGADYDEAIRLDAQYALA